jgi:type IV pilus assembly protein PilA
MKLGTQYWGFVVFDSVTFVASSMLSKINHRLKGTQHMRASIKNYMDALKKQREERGEDAEGFSLIELIVVVVILGILAAVAIPVFLGLQAQAAQTAQDAVAANAASQAAASFATNDTYAPAAADFAKMTDGGTYTFAPTGTSIDNFCISVSGGGAAASKSGPGCTP